MTAIDDENYAAISLTPNVVVDFSSGEAVVRFNLSTTRSSSRDWVDLWITPYDLNLIQPLQEWFPDLQGPPKEAILIELSQDNAFNLTVFQNFQEKGYTLGVEGANFWTGYNSFLDPSETRRDTFELRLRRDHVDFCMPDYQFCWIDIDLDNPLSWSQGIVQFSHHSYTAAKACNHDGSCGPNTWHWDDFVIYPATAFKMIHGDRRFIERDSPQITFDQPAPAGAHLRFAGLGDNLELSFDGGKTWKPAVRQQQKLQAEEHFSAYWTPIPPGTSTVQVRGQAWWGGDWHVRSLAIWAPAP